MNIPRFLVSLYLLGLLAQPLCAADTVCATLGTWTHDLSAAKKLADTYDRPLVVMFSNSSGKCPWCNLFETKIGSSATWNSFCVTQQLAMASIDFAINWNEAYYQSVATTNSGITGFPAFVLYGSSGTNVLASFSYNSTSDTFTASAFVEKISAILTSTGNLVNQEDIWDPTDNIANGATTLDFKPYDQSQYHDLNKTPSDTADWFKFLCVSGRKYKLQVPSAATIGVVTELTGSNLVHTPNLNLPPGTFTNTLKLTTTTNVVSVLTNNFQLLSISTNFSLTVTNGLPFFIQLLTNAVDTSKTVTTNLTPNVVTNSHDNVTKLPSAKEQAIDNGVPPEAMSPFITFFDPTRKFPLDVDTGPSGFTNSFPLAQLTNGCVFAPASKFNNSYCFIRITQENTNALGSFDTVMYQPPSTNRTITTTVSNVTEVTVNQLTRTNVWLFVTNSTPVFQDDRWNIFVFSNQFFVTSTIVITNTTITSNKWEDVTKEVVTLGTNYYTNIPNGTEYTLDYRLWEPGTISFASTNITASEAAASVPLTVTRKGGTAGSVRLHYRFEDKNNSDKGYTAENGKDYKAVEGEVSWREGQSGSTNITVSLIQDLHPTWEGDERFAVVLEMTNGADFFQAPVIASNAVVTLKESATKKPGILVFSGYGTNEDTDPASFPNVSKPAVTVKEGESVTLWVARTGGSNGKASVAVTTANAPADAEATLTPSSLTWEDGDSRTQAVTLATTLRDGFNNDATFTVKFTAPTNATLGKTAAAVTVTLRDVQVASGLADSAASATPLGLALKASTGFWFWADTTALRSEPLFTKGQKAVLQLALTGPGVLSFDWSTSELVASDILTCAGGVFAGKSFASSGGANSVFVKPGPQTVTWTLSRNTNDWTSGSFANLDGLKWQPMPKAENPAPANNARTSSVDLQWDTPTTNAVVFGVPFTTDEAGGLTVSYSAVAVSPSGRTLPEVTFTSFSDLWNGAAPIVNNPYTWRVDTVYVDDTLALTNKGTAWSFTAIADNDDKDTELPAGGNVDNSYEVLQGVQCDLEDITDVADALTYTVSSGTLPPGLSLTKNTGRISGTPIKAGTWTFLLQATETATKRSYNTVAMSILVYPLGTFSGTYNGWIKPAAGASSLAYSGAATLSLTEAGKLTAKLTVKGTDYPFSAAALDRAEGGLSAPDAVTLDASTGALVTESSGLRHTNTLSNLIFVKDGTATATLTLHTLITTGRVSRAESAEYSVQLFRDAWKDPGMTNVLAAFKGYYTVALPVTAENHAANAPAGSGYVTLTVADTGVAKLSGVLADGKTWSSATTLLYPGSTFASDNQALVYVYAQPIAYNKNGGLCGSLIITADSDTVTSNIIDSAMQWWNFAPTSVSGADDSTLSETSGFLNAVGAYGGFYDTVMNLQTYYLCRKLTFDDSSVFPATNSLPRDYDGLYGLSKYCLVTNSDDELRFMPFGTQLTVGAQAFSVPAKNIVRKTSYTATGSSFANIDEENSVNLSGLTIRLARATGLLAGSFVLNYERIGTSSLRTRTVSFKGVHTTVRPAAVPEAEPDPADDAPISRIEADGFYLIPDTSSYIDNTGRNHPYSFDWSFPFELNSVEAHDRTWCQEDLDE